MHYVILIISIIFNASSGVLLKYSVADGLASSTRSKLLMFAGWACGSISAILYTKSLENINLGVAATISAGMVIVVSNAAGVLLFGEGLNLAKCLGALLVCVGIWLVVR